MHTRTHILSDCGNVSQAFKVTLWGPVPACLLALLEFSFLATSLNLHGSLAGSFLSFCLPLSPKLVQRTGQGHLG